MNIHVSWRAASSGHRREIAATLSPDTIGEGTMDRSGEWHSLARVPRHFSRRNVTVSPPRRGQRPWRLRGWLVGRSGYEGADGPAGSAIPGLKRSDCRHHRVMPCLSWQASHVMNPRGVLAASWIRDSKRRHAVTARVSKRNCNLQFSSAIRQETLVISERPTTAGEGERKRDGGDGGRERGRRLPRRAKECLERVSAPPPGKEGASDGSGLPIAFPVAGRDALRTIGPDRAGERCRLASLRERNRGGRIAGCNSTMRVSFFSSFPWILIAFRSRFRVTARDLPHVRSPQPPPKREKQSS